MNSGNKRINIFRDSMYNGGAEPNNGEISQFFSNESSVVLYGGLHECHDKNMKVGM